MWTELLVILAGFALLTWSADRFVTGAAAVAWNLQVSPLIIGLTIVSFGTSAPEIIVSVMAAMQGNAGLAIGNAIGSNIINIALVLGMTAVIMPLQVQSGILRRELPILIGVMALTWLLIMDGSLERMDGAVLLGGLVALLAWVTQVGLRSAGQRDPIDAEFAGEIETGMSLPRALFWLLTGLALLLLSSRLLVWGAVSLAQGLGVSDLIIGLTIVALGTSLPELAASVMSALRQEHDIAIGNIIGSNMFNMLAVLGLPGLIRPGPVDAEVLTRDFPVMLLLTVLFTAMAIGFRARGRINRIEGVLLLAIYIGYQTLLYFSATA